MPTLLLPAILLAGCLSSSASAYEGLVAKHAVANGVPESLVRRVIIKESGGNARAVSQGNYGLMQIRLGTARAMGYSGSAEGLLDADTNMTYAVKYLAGAYRVAGGNHDRAVALYQRGYYDVAKAQGTSPYRVAAREPAAGSMIPSLFAPAPAGKTEPAGRERSTAVAPAAEQAHAPSGVMTAGRPPHNDSRRVAAKPKAAPVNPFQLLANWLTPKPAKPVQQRRAQARTPVQPSTH